MKNQAKNSTIIGVISDTHGLFRPEVINHFKDCNLIIHAGDIGDIKIINELKKNFPVKAIRGNVDKNKWAEIFPETISFKAGKYKLFVVHNIKEINSETEKKYDIIISGHSHKPSIKEEGGTIYFNPGSAGKRRFDLPVSIGKIYLAENKITPEIIRLNVQS